MKTYDYEEHYDEAIKWTIQEVIDALTDIQPADLTHEQWADIYFALERKDFEEAYKADLESAYDPYDFYDPMDYL